MRPTPKTAPATRPPDGLTRMLENLYSTVERVMDRPARKRKSAKSVELASKSA